jgi:uncharacterized protein (UPF0264 family)
MKPMRILVSVRDAEEARAAIDGGADIIDAKDPAQGPLGPVALDTLGAIVGAATPLRPVSAALGDLTPDCTPESAERDTRAILELGLAFVKVGLTGIPDVATAARAARVFRGALTGESAPALVLASYADLPAPAGLGAWDVLEAAKQSGAAGVLLDTASKGGLLAASDDRQRLATEGGQAAPTRRTLFDYITPDTIAPWISAAHAAGLFVALAGSLGIDDLPRARSLEADIMGVRGAVCDGGRTGVVSADRVRELIERNGGPGHAGRERDPEVRVDQAS